MKIIFRILLKICDDPVTTSFCAHERDICFCLSWEGSSKTNISVWYCMYMRQKIEKQKTIWITHFKWRRDWLNSPSGLPHFVLMKETVYGLSVLNPETSVYREKVHRKQTYQFITVCTWDKRLRSRRPFHKSTCEMFISIEGFWPLCDSMIVIRLEDILNDIIGCYRATLGGMLWSLKVISEMLTDMTWL